MVEDFPNAFSEVVSPIFGFCRTQDEQKNAFNKLTPVEKVAARYIFNVYGYINGLNANSEEPTDELYMRKIEERINVSRENVDDFRRSVIALMGMMFHKNSYCEVSWDFSRELTKSFLIEVQELN